jgi:hypothetical protein
MKVGGKMITDGGQMDRYGFSAAISGRIGAFHRPEGAARDDEGVADDAEGRHTGTTSTH